MPSLTLPQWRRLLSRDDAMCAHCGTTDGTLVPGHRLGRGSGGSRVRHVPSNLVVMCSWLNGRIEDDPGTRRWAQSLGLSLLSWQDPAEVVMWSMPHQAWFLLADDWTRTEIPGPTPSTVGIPHR